MTWNQIKVGCSTADIDRVAAIMSMVETSLMIEDYSDVDEGVNKIYGELLDESIVGQDRSRANVSIFLSEEKNVPETIAFLEARFADTGIDFSLEMVGVNENDWADNWKKYYKPIHIGKRIVIVPKWEMYDPQEGEIIVKIDPGMAFGTGSHETTKLCIELIEKHLNTAGNVLDIGTGSGILAILAAKLGVAEVDATDIDSVAVRVANDNFAENAVPKVNCFVSDLLGAVDKKYDTIFANIVADIIIRLAPDLPRCTKKGSKVIISGVIERQAADVEAAMAEYGFALVTKTSENDWNAFVFRRL